MSNHQNEVLLEQFKENGDEVISHLKKAIDAMNDYAAFTGFRKVEIGQLEALVKRLEGIKHELR